jgi:hypothetical protein
MSKENDSIEAKELAKMLDVTPSAISYATKKDHLCKGYPVAEWADRTSRGRVNGYRVPENIYMEFISSTTTKTKESGMKTDESSGKKLRDKVFNQWLEATKDLTLPEIDEKEKEVKERFGGLPLEEFKKVKKRRREEHKRFDQQMSEVEEMLNSIA